MMNFEHVALGTIPLVPEDPLEYHRDVTHQVHRVVVDDYIPGKIQRGLSLFLGQRFSHNAAHLLRRVLGWRQAQRLPPEWPGPVTFQPSRRGSRR